MALMSLILTAAGVSAVVLRVKQSAPIFRRNLLKHIRNWIEEETAASQNAKPKELETKAPHKDIPKEDKH